MVLATNRRDGSAVASRGHVRKPCVRTPPPQGPGLASSGRAQDQWSAPRASSDLAAAAAPKSEEGALRLGRRRIDVGGGDLVPHKMSHDHVSCLMERNTPRANS